MPRSTTASDPPNRWWLLLVPVLLTLQLVLFTRWVRREITWGYPVNNDQTQYLIQGYQTYEHIRQEGLLAGLWHGLALPLPQGALLHIEAALAFLLLGPSRETALLLNVLHFAAFECVLAAVLYRLTRRGEVALAGLGLLTAAATPFYFAGGIGDFRLDFIAWCLFGIFLCLVVRSHVFASMRWSLVAGLVAALLGLFRFIAAIYMAAIFAVVIAALLVRHRRAGSLRHVRRLRGAAAAAALFGLLTLPVLAARGEALRGYYVVGHLTGPERGIRAREQGVLTLAQGLLFYPASALRHHAGVAFLAAAAVAVAGSLLHCGAGRRRAVLFPRGLRALYGFAAVSGVVPLAILTLNEAKSPVVGHVLVPPLLWLAVLPLVGVARRPGAHEPSPRLFRWTAWLVFAVGLSFQVLLFHRRTVHSAHGQDVASVAALHDLIAAVSRERGWTSPLVSSDHVADYWPAIAVATYERHGWMFAPRLTALGGAIFPLTREAALGELRRSDFVAVTLDDRPRASPYPFDEAIHSLRPALRDACRREMVPLQRFQLYGRDVMLYVRPPG